MTFTLSFDAWRRYFWSDFQTDRGDGPDDDECPTIAAALRDAYDQGISPDDNTLFDTIFALQMQELSAST